MIDGWFALDLTSDIATGLGAWSVDEIATYLKTGVDKDKTTTLGPMAELIRNSTSYLTDADLQGDGRIPEVDSAGVALRTGRVAPDPTQAARRARSISDHCGGCHQALRPRHSRRVPTAGRQRRRRRRRSQQHRQGRRPRYSARAPATSPMPAFRTQLTDQQVADIANYVRTSWGNAAAPNATPAMVAKLRAGPSVTAASMLAVSTLGFAVPAGAATGTVHSVFARACNIALDGGLVTVGIAPLCAGPSNVVIESRDVPDLRRSSGSASASTGAPAARDRSVQRSTSHGRGAGGRRERAGRFPSPNRRQPPHRGLPHRA